MVFVGAVLPALVTVAPSMARYLFDRVHWAAYDFGRYSPPSLTSYLPTLQIWTLSLIFSAFAEEVIFRGVLQRHFVSRLGVWRGIFLTGIVWAAFHFPGDTYSASSDQQIIFGLLHRIAQCLILGFVLSWLTLRSGSLLPPTLAHWLSNVGVYSAREPDYPGRNWLNAILWLLVVWVLFRYWPVENIDTNELAKPAMPLSELDPAGE